MYGIQPLHLVVILFVALLIFGPSRISEIGRALGKTVGEFRAAANEPTARAQRDTGSAPPKQGPPTAA